VVGETLVDCRLIHELGRGVRGRIFLASQTLLADRLVVLKVTSEENAEHLSLARLLHTHIVPLLFAQEVPVRGMRVLAMPYLGGASLSAVQARLRDRPCRERTGLHLLEALDAAQAGLPDPSGAPTATTVWPVRARLGQSSYPSVVCWLGACLAGALQHAHERGVVHLDVKPGNVLLAADGQPLLLDFHLARSPLVAGTDPPTWFGGTPEYMAPEQHQVMAATGEGLPIPVNVDGRADLYSLGAVLYELLGGCLPLPPGSARKQARLLRECNPNVSVGLADIVCRCLAPAPEQRYASCADLAADLRRHLANLPLQGVVNRDLHEQWVKWRRRRPQALVRAALAVLALAALMSSLLLGDLQLRERHRQVDDALKEGQEALGRGEADEAFRAFSRGQSVGWFPGAEPLRQQLAVQAQNARNAAQRQEQNLRRQRLSGDLARLADELRFFWDVSTLSVKAVRTLDQRCAALWGGREILLDRPAPSHKEANDLRELLVLWGQLQDRLAGAGEREAVRARAAQRAQELEQALAASGAGSQVAFGPQSAWEQYTAGRALLRRGETERAAEQFAQAVAAQPDGFWPNFYQGVCAHRLGRHEEAVAAFRTCIALAPRSSPCYVNRAVAERARGRHAAALADLDRAVQLAPDLADAWLERGLVRVEQERPREALDDLRRALDLGADPARCHYNLAQVHRAAGDRVQAMRHARQALESRPDHPGARRLLHRLLRETKTAPGQRQGLPK
jgi:tetratricopeptide (TPR) repeat protein